MNKPSGYTDAELTEIVHEGNAIIQGKHPSGAVLFPQPSFIFKAWLLGGIIEAKRELMRRETKTESER